MKQATIYLTKSEVFQLHMMGFEQDICIMEGGEAAFTEQQLSLVLYMLWDWKFKGHEAMKFRSKCQTAGNNVFGWDKK